MSEDKFNPNNSRYMCEQQAGEGFQQYINSKTNQLPYETNVHNKSQIGFIENY